MDFLQEMNETVARELASFEKQNSIPAIAPTGLTKNVSRLRDAVKSAREEIALVNYPQAKRDQLNHDLLEAARVDLQGLLVQELDGVSASLARERESYERKVRTNRTEYDREVSAAEKRFAAMSGPELRAYAEDLARNPRPLAPEIIDALSVALKPYALPPDQKDTTKGLPPDPGTFDGFREIVQKERFYEPWRFTDPGKRLSHYEKTLEYCIRDGSLIPVCREDGSVTTEGLRAVIGEV